MITPIPDRERRHLIQFYIAPKMGYRTRLTIAGVFVAAGLLLQLLLPIRDLGVTLTGGAALLFVGNLFLFAKGYDLRPAAESGGEWERSTEERFREIPLHDSKVRSWDEAAVDATCSTGCLTGFFLVLLPIVVLCLVLAATGRQGEEYALLLAIDSAVLILPHWITGTRRKWRPVAVVQSVQSLLTAMEALKSFDRPPCQVQPMLRVTGGEGDKVPVDARVFIRFPDGPEDFLGLQLQVSLNNVRGTAYPYLYAVLVARHSFGLLKDHAAKLRSFAHHLTVEESVDDEVEVIVLRQHTTKDSGYHTNPRAVAGIARTAWECAVWILAEPVTLK